METYIITRLIKAQPMSFNEFASKILNQIDKNEKNLNGYLIIYPGDNYQSWCEKKAFEKYARKISEEEEEL